MLMTKDDKALLELLKLKTGKDAFKCAICDGFFYGYGNNPYPVIMHPDARCCDECNISKVVPARIVAMSQKATI